MKVISAIQLAEALQRLSATSPNCYWPVENAVPSLALTRFHHEHPKLKKRSVLWGGPIGECFGRLINRPRLEVR